MTERLIFKADNQEQISEVAVKLSTALEPVLPRVPWLSKFWAKRSIQKDCSYGF